MPAPVDIAGQRFGHLVATSRVPGSRRAHGGWRCRCDCGHDTVVHLSSLRSGRTRSCGCRKAIPKTHGLSGSREYFIWKGIKYRCSKPNAPSAVHYIDRGITMCDRWRDSFEAFIADVGPAPSARHSIDRIDNAGSYDPSNCRWVLQKDQMRNMRRNHLLSHDGCTRTIAEWAERTGLNTGTIWTRIVTLGWTAADAVTYPPWQFKRGRVVTRHLNKLRAT